MVNGLGWDFGCPVPPPPAPSPPPSMIVLEICLLCDLTSTFTDKTVRRSQNLDPQNQGRAVQSSGQWRVGNGYTRVYQKALWVEGFFSKLFLSLDMDFYITYYYLSFYTWLCEYLSMYPHIYTYICAYIHTHTSPRLGAWRALRALFAEEVTELCPRNICNAKNVPVKVLNRKYVRFKAL